MPLAHERQAQDGPHPPAKDGGIGVEEPLTLGIAEHVLVNEVNSAIVAQIDRQGRKAMGLHSLASCVVFGKRLFLEDQEQQRRIDVGLVGEVDWVNAVGTTKTSSIGSLKAS